MQVALTSGTVRPGIAIDDLVAVATATWLAIGQPGSSKTRIPHLIGRFFDGIGAR